MKILLCLPSLPFPAEKDGFALTMNNLIVNWALEHKITLYYFGEMDSIAEVYFQNIGCVTIHQNLLNSDYGALKQLSRNPLKIFQPRSCWNYLYSDSNLFIDEYFDLAIFSRFESIYLDKIVSSLNYSHSVFFELDLISLLYLRMSQVSSTITNKMYNFLQYKVVRKAERDLYNQFDKIAFVSSVDRDYARSFYPQYEKSKFFNIRNGVIPQLECTSRKKIKSEVKIGFSGDFAYKPNLLAAHFIINKILPELKKIKSNYVLVLIGRNPDQYMLQQAELNSSNLIVTGEVDDPLQEVSKLDVYFSPLFVGTGMKNKILNAMSIGVPIVCSAISSEGIEELEPNLNYFYCESNDPSLWIEKIIKLVESDETRHQFSKNTIAIIRREYNWTCISKEFLSLAVG